jgi:hypothetical protein
VPPLSMVIVPALRLPPLRTNVPASMYNPPFGFAAPPDPARVRVPPLSVTVACASLSASP